MTEFILYDFISFMKAKNVVPSEKHIRYFLEKEGKQDLEKYFVIFCFYYWEDRLKKDVVQEFVGEANKMIKGDINSHSRHKTQTNYLHKK